MGYHLFFSVSISAPQPASHLLHVVHLLENSFSSAEGQSGEKFMASKFLSNVISHYFKIHIQLCMSMYLFNTTWGDKLALFWPEAVNSLGDEAIVEHWLVTGIQFVCGDSGTTSHWAILLFLLLHFSALEIKAAPLGSGRPLHFIWNIWGTNRNSFS